jgi:hypothetical protein
MERLIWCIRLHVRCHEDHVEPRESCFHRQKYLARIEPGTNVVILQLTACFALSLRVSLGLVACPRPGRCGHVNRFCVGEQTPLCLPTTLPSNTFNEAHEDRLRRKRILSGPLRVNRSHLHDAINIEFDLYYCAWTDTWRGGKRL